MSAIRYAAAALDLLSDQRILYDGDSIRALFDEMAVTYGVVNLLTSFGFSFFWRRWATRRLIIQSGDSIADLMCGQGELWSMVADRIGPNGSICGVDLSPGMVARSRQPACRLDLHTGDVLEWTPPENSYDAVASSFGLKTFSRDQLRHLAQLVARVLKPGGSFAFVEISVPDSGLIKAPYLFYLKRAIPVFGGLFLGNPDNYRMLGTYTEAFRDCGIFASALREADLVVNESSLFFGCATGVWGRKSAAA